MQTPPPPHLEGDRGEMKVVEHRSPPKCSSSYRAGLTLSHGGDAVLRSFAAHSGRSVFLAVTGLYRWWNAVFIAGSDSSGDDRCLLPHRPPPPSSPSRQGTAGDVGPVLCGTPKSPWWAPGDNPNVFGETIDPFSVFYLKTCSDILSMASTYVDLISVPWRFLKCDV